MGELLDAVTWANLLPFTEPVMGYIDGRESEWPAEAWDRLGPRVALRISVLANDAAQVLDSEAGNAGVEAVANAVAARLDRKEWTVVYSNRDNLPALTGALWVKSIHWMDAQHWPQPGVYLHAADPTGEPHLLVPWAPVQPVAVQDRWMGGYDISTCYGTYPIIPPSPTPVRPPTPVEVPIQVQILQLQEKASGDPVEALQILLNGRIGAGLHVDGVFGPLTLAQVKRYQTAAHLAVDGVVGPKTWGHLLGVP